MAETTVLRRIPFENIANFRDLGGYAAGAGMTRWGVLYRSARLTRATQAELDALAGLGIRTVIDLRMTQEEAMRPDAGKEDPRLGWRHLSLLGALEEDPGALRELPDEVPPMSTLYLQMLQRCQDGFRRLFAALAEGLSRGAVLFHCTAGKDRTGLTAALLLGLLGVDRLDIIADYQVSRTYNLRFMPEDTTGSDPEHMVIALDALDDEYGGAEGFLKAAGVADGALDGIRGRFWVPAR